uniref:NGF domain-containing protein n=1 Tax=Panagrellus redivivus TaxID=6233 RepID=A0A7E4V9H7_PANRE
MTSTQCAIVVLSFALAGFGFPSADYRSFGQQSKEKVDACDQVAAWEEVTEARNVNGDIVRVAQNQESGPQIFYTVRCNSVGEMPCRGIQASISSRCETRLNAMAAIVEDETRSNGLRWDMIMVPGQCVCAEFLNNTLSIS